jgi:hypothetical protein
MQSEILDSRLRGNDGIWGYLKALFGCENGKIHEFVNCKHVWMFDIFSELLRFAHNDEKKDGFPFSWE